MRANRSFVFPLFHRLLGEFVVAMYLLSHGSDHPVKLIGVESSDSFWGRLAGMRASVKSFPKPPRGNDRGGFMFVKSGDGQPERFFRSGSLGFALPRQV